MWKIIYTDGIEQHEIDGRSEQNVIDKYKRVSASGYGYKVIEIYDVDERQMIETYQKKKDQEYLEIIKSIDKSVKAVLKTPVLKSGRDNVKVLKASYNVLKRLKKEYVNANANANVEIDNNIFISATDDYIKKCGY